MTDYPQSSQRRSFAIVAASLVLPLIVMPLWILTMEYLPALRAWSDQSPLAGVPALLVPVALGAYMLSRLPWSRGARSFAIIAYVPIIITLAFVLAVSAECLIAGRCL
jgi:hypothetical protein